MTDVRYRCTRQTWQTLAYLYSHSFLASGSVRGPQGERCSSNWWVPLRASCWSVFKWVCATQLVISVLLFPLLPLALCSFWLPPPSLHVWGHAAEQWSLFESLYIHRDCLLLKMYILLYVMHSIQNVTYILLVYVINLQYRQDIQSSCFIVRHSLCDSLISRSCLKPSASGETVFFAQLSCVQINWFCDFTISIKRLFSHIQKHLVTST